MNREMYDLCRRYQYFYKALKEVESVYHKYGYHAPQLKCACDDIKKKLEDVRNDLVVESLKDGAESVMEFTVSNDYHEYDSWGSPFVRVYSGRPARVDMEISCSDTILSSILSRAIYEVKYGKK